MVKTQLTSKHTCLFVVVRRVSVRFTNIRPKMSRWRKLCVVRSTRIDRFIFMLISTIFFLQ